MDEVEFKRLVAFTRQAFGPRHQPEWGESPAETRARHYRILPERARGEFLHGLIVDSAESKMAWDSVKLIAEELLRAKDHLPDELAAWIADVLFDHRKPKKEQRRPRPATGGSKDANRDWVICGAIHHIGIRFNLLPTRNGGGPPKCCAEGGSACDVVGLAFLGGSLKAYKNAERIWRERDTLLSYEIQPES